MLLDERAIQLVVRYSKSRIAKTYSKLKTTKLYNKFKGPNGSKLRNQTVTVNLKDLSPTVK